MRKPTKADKERAAREAAELARLQDERAKAYSAGRRSGYEYGSRYGLLYALKYIIADAEKNGTTPTIPVAILDEARTLIDAELKRLSMHDGDFHVAD